MIHRAEKYLLPSSWQKKLAALGSKWAVLPGEQCMAYVLWAMAVGLSQHERWPSELGAILVWYFHLLILASPSRITANLWRLVSCDCRVFLFRHPSSPSQICPQPVPAWCVVSPFTPLHAVLWACSILPGFCTYSGVPELCSFLWKLAAWSRAWKKRGALLSSWRFEVFIVFWISGFFFHFWLSFNQWKSRSMVIVLETTSRLTLAHWSVWYWYNCQTRYNATS